MTCRWILWTVLGIAAVAGEAVPIPAAEDAPSPLRRDQDNPALARFGRSVLLYVSFDGHEYAEITFGDPKPTGNAAWAALKDRADYFVPGLVGHGLRSGAHQLVYTCPKDGLGAAGSVALWLKPEQLHHRGTYCWPAILDALEGGYRVQFGRIGHPANREVLYAHLAHAKANVNATRDSMAEWTPGAWHLFVVTWDRNGVELSIDGRQPTRASLKTPIAARPPGGLRVHLLGQNEDTFIYDEFLVLDVPLKPEEIHWLYEQGTKRAK